MALVIKVLILILCAIVVFARNSFSSPVLYWIVFVAMFALVPVWWFVEYWVSEKKAKQFLNEEFEKSFFVRMPTEGIGDDFTRGRLCICNDELKLISKSGSSYKVTYTIKRDQISLIGTSENIAGKKGLIITAKNKEYSFISKKADEIVGALK